MRAKFIKGFVVDEAVVLQHFISMNHDRQSNENFKAFIEMVQRLNKNQKQRINKVEIDLSCYLQRHYVGNAEAEKIGKKWREENENSLKMLNIPYEIIGWKDLISKIGYGECFEKVTKLFQTDDAFKLIVTNLAKQHSHKADFDSAKNYLLEECAVFLNTTGHICYPSTELNAAVSFVLKKFESKLKFHGFMLYQEPEKKLENSCSANDEKLFKTCLKISKLMELSGIYSKTDQMRFFF